MSPTNSSLTTARTDLTTIRTELLKFLWRQWAQLGAASDVPFQDSWLLDTEALLLFTLSLGRYDPRLLDEVLDWCATNTDILSVQRLKRLCPTDPNSLTTRTLAAVASLLRERTGSVRWRVLQSDEATNDAQSYFLESDGSPFPLFGPNDPHFLHVGLLRSPVKLRNLSITPRLDLPVALVLKLRALFGVDPRAEAIAYLMTHQVVGARELARATVCASATAHALLKALHTGQFLVGSGREGYALEQERWQAFLLGGQNRPVPKWIAWSVVLPALVNALEVTADQGQESDYLRSSRWLRADESMCRALKGSGLPNPFSIPIGLEEVEHALPERLHHLSRILASEL